MFRCCTPRNRIHLENSVFLPGYLCISHFEANSNALIRFHESPSDALVSFLEICIDPFVAFSMEKHFSDTSYFSSYSSETNPSPHFSHLLSFQSAILFYIQQYGTKKKTQPKLRLLLNKITYTHARCIPWI